MPRVVFFDVSADEPKRAIGFYSRVFGWEIKKWEGPIDYWLMKTGVPTEPGIDGGLARRENPSQFIIPVIDVSSVDEFAAKVTENGGKIVRPKMAIPWTGYLVSCQDTEGNTFNIMEQDESAK